MYIKIKMAPAPYLCCCLSLFCSKFYSSVQNRRKCEYNLVCKKIWLYPRQWFNVRRCARVVLLLYTSCKSGSMDRLLLNYIDLLENCLRFIGYPAHTYIIIMWSIGRDRKRGTFFTKNIWQGLSAKGIKFIRQLCKKYFYIVCLFLIKLISVHTLKSRTKVLLKILSPMIKTQA